MEVGVFKKIFSPDYLIGTLAVIIFLAIIILPSKFKANADNNSWTTGTMPNLQIGGPGVTQYDYQERRDCTAENWTYLSWLDNNGNITNNPIEKSVQVCQIEGVGTGPDGTYIKANLAYKMTNNNGFGTSGIPNSQTVFRTATSLGGLDGFGFAFLDSLSNYGIYKAHDPIYHRTTYSVQNGIRGNQGDFFKYTNGQIINLRKSVFSSNGKYMLGETYAGFLLKVNVETRQAVKVRWAGYQYNQGYDPTPNFAISDDGNTVFVYDVEGKARVYDTTTCVVKPLDINVKTAEGCAVRDVTTSITAKEPNFTGLTNIRFTPDGKSVYGIIGKKDPATNVRSSYKFILSVTGHEPNPIDYLAMGDSFASGEGDNDGNPWYESGTDSNENKCHLSKRSYPYLLSEYLQAHEFHSVACSGAKIPNLNNIVQYPNSGLSNQWLPGIKPQNDYLSGLKPSFLTISIGGNDLNFAGILSDCVVNGLANGNCAYLVDPAHRGIMAMQITDQYPKLKDAYSKLISRTNGDTRIYVMGYPQFIKRGGEGNCANNVRLNDQEREFIYQGIKYANQIIKAAAEDSGAYYLDIENSLDNKNLCSQIPDNQMTVNGVTIGNDTGAWVSIYAPGTVYTGKLGLGNESFHPNEKAQPLIRDRILQLTNNNPSIFQTCPTDFTRATCPHGAGKIPLPDAGYFGSVALNYAQAKNGVSTIRVSPPPKPQNIAVAESSSVQNFKIHVESQKPNSQIRIEGHSTPVDLGTYNVDVEGKADVTLNLENKLLPGLHEIHIFTTNFAGEAEDLYQTILITGQDGDINGNGVTDSQDKCGFTAQSNMDIDHDGIDDACDGDLATPPKDQLPPNVVGSIVNQPNEEGWYNSPQTIIWQATDPEPSSGVPTQPDSTPMNTEGENTYSSGQSCDPLNQCAAGTFSAKLDTTLPEINYQISPLPTSEGWNNGTVQITFFCSDQTSGVKYCNEPITTDQEGEFIVTGTTGDYAGNINSVNIIVKIDKTNPEITLDKPTANQYGWYNQDVSIDTTCQDSLSGVAKCAGPVTISEEGKDLAREFQAEDRAGNSATATTSVNIDKTKPIIMTTAISNNVRSPSGMSQLTAEVADGLSGAVRAEYFIGDEDPGEGNGAFAEVKNDSVGIILGSDYQPGIYAINLRVQDTAGNWSEVATDYLIVHENAKFKSVFAGVISLNNDVNMPFLLTQTDPTKAHISILTSYNRKEQITKSSKLYAYYKTGKKCLGKQPINCHKFGLRSSKIDWVTTDQNNPNRVILEGQGTLKLDTSNREVFFKAEYAKDTQQITLKIYTAKPNTASAPDYSFTTALASGSVIIN